MHRLLVFCKWCEDLPLLELAKELAQTGADGVDLPCRPGARIEPDDAAKMLPEAKAIFADHGLTLDRLVTGITCADDQADRLLAAAADVGVRQIRLGSFNIKGGANAAERLDQCRRQLGPLQELLARRQVKAAIQNHSGNCLEVNISSALRLLQDCDPQWLGVQYDPGHLTLSGEPIGVAVDLMGAYLHSVNFKSPRQEYFVDAQTGRLCFKPIWVPMRDGMLDVPGVLKKLEAVGYVDAIAIHAEYRTHYHYIEMDRTATTQLITQDIGYVRRIYQAV